MARSAGGRGGKTSLFLACGCCSCQADDSAHFCTDLQAQIIQEEFGPAAALARAGKPRDEKPRYKWDLWREPEDRFDDEWGSASDVRRRSMLQARSNELLCKRIGRRWDPTWTVVYTSQPPPWTQAPEMKATRQRLVWWLDRYPPFDLGERWVETKGWDGSVCAHWSSRFLSQDEMALVSIVVGLWPEGMDPKKIAAGHENVLKAEGDSMKKAIAEYGYAGSRDALGKHERRNRMPLVRGLQRRLASASPIGAPHRLRGHENAPNR